VLDCLSSEVYQTAPFTASLLRPLPNPHQQTFTNPSANVYKPDRSHFLRYIFSTPSLHPITKRSGPLPLSSLAVYTLQAKPALLRPQAPRPESVTNSLADSASVSALFAPSSRQLSSSYSQIYHRLRRRSHVRRTTPEQLLCTRRLQRSRHAQPLRPARPGPRRSSVPSSRHAYVPAPRRQ
jgi:hypothetical protein